jgi:tetratricopeptide (TPR) repeat protein
LGEYEAALRLCREILADQDAPSRALTAALVEEGYCLEATGALEAAFADFEKALEREPTDQDVRFHLAYEYSQHGFREPALAHYLILASHSPTPMSLNNLGAALHDFGLPILGTKRYKEAAAKGEALASGNLAMRLLDVGFVDEALRRIAEGEASEKTNRMVVGAASRIDAEQLAEQTKLEKLSRAGGSLREVFKQFQGTEPATIPAGRFRTTTGQQLDLVVEKGVSTGKTDDGVEITLTPKGPLLELGWKDRGLFSATYGGKAIFRDRRISGYYKNAKGENIAFIADTADRVG